MDKSYRPWTPNQSYLLPPSPRDWLPEDHLALFLLDVVHELDLSAIEAKLQAKDHRGTRPYNPAMMLTLLFLAYCTGMASSRKIERATWEDLGFRVIAGELHPDHTSISEFRREHLVELKALFKQVLLLCREAGLVKLGHVALDGTKEQANASKHKAMSYKRMKETERRLQQEVEALMREAETVDASEDAKYGKGKRGDELPGDLARRETRLQKIREAKAQLEAEAAAVRAQELAERAEEQKRKAESAEASERAKLERAAKRAEQRAKAAADKAATKATEAGLSEPVLVQAPDGLPSHRVKANAKGDPKPKAQRNFTEPESQIMKSGGAFVQAYNCQAAVDDECQIIVAEAVTNQAPDCEHLEPMLDLIEKNTDQLPKVFTADTGYFSVDNVAKCEARGIDAYIPPQRAKHGTTPAPSAAPTDSTDAKATMRSKLNSKAGRANYAKRKGIVEPVFGQIKGAQRFRRFSMRGLEKARGEWSFVCTTHNLLKLWRSRRSRAR